MNKSLESFQEVYNSLSGIKNLAYKDLRASAWERLQNLCIPTVAQEAWKYTDIRAPFKLNYELASKQQSSCDLEACRRLVEEQRMAEDCLVFLNGQYQESLSSFREAEGVRLCLVQLNEECSCAYNSLNSVFSDQDSFFFNLNSALFHDAVLLKIADNVEVKEELQIINLSIGSGHVLSAPRLFFQMGKFSKLNVIENFISETEGETSCLTCPVSEYDLAENSFLSLTRVIAESSNTFHVSQQEAKVAGAATFETKLVNLNGKVIRNNINVRLEGEQAFTRLLGLTAINSQTHVDNQTVIEHIAPHCESEEIFKGIYAQEAKGIFDGTIIVHQDAQKTNAIQSNQVVLLSEQAKSYSKPQLKIWADDVKCTHGATCGQFDEEALFYLRARGVPEAQAKKMLVRAFASELFDGIGNADLLRYLEAKVNTNLVF